MTSGNIPNVRMSNSITKLTLTEIIMITVSCGITGSTVDFQRSHKLLSGSSGEAIKLPMNVHGLECREMSIMVGRKLEETKDLKNGVTKI